MPKLVFVPLSYNLSVYNIIKLWLILIHMHLINFRFELGYYKTWITWLYLYVHLYHYYTCIKPDCDGAVSTLSLRPTNRWPEIRSSSRWRHTQIISRVYCSSRGKDWVCSTFEHVHVYIHVRKCSTMPDVLCITFKHNKTYEPYV